MLLTILLAAASLSARPKGESTVVGCLIVDVIGSYLKEEGPVCQEYDVRIDCKYLNKNGKARQYSFMTKTDEAGYFKLEKVPGGKYVLKAAEFVFARGGRITLASRFGRADLSGQSRYWGMLTGMMMDNAVDLQNDQIEVEPRQGLIDLGITYIQIKADEQATGAGMPRTSPDGRPPWRRITLTDRNTMIDLFIISSSVHSTLADQPLGAETTVYSKRAPAVYFGLQ
ncbi:hypothetical protein JW998_08580 [candidate division KSB1 bacterium]|nr:hypothetical protein [candidate division KSB1 bacterium]